MAEYIDRDATIEWLEANKRVYDRENKILIADQDTIIEWLKTRPTADVAPVVHAHWKYVKRLPDGSIWNDYVCSKCGQLATDTEAENWFAYCPTCGAKMDEVSDG